MYEQQIVCLVIPLVIVVVLSGPAALIISIVALNKIKEMQSFLDRKIASHERMPEIKLPTGVASEPLWAPEKPPEVVKAPPAAEPDQHRAVGVACGQLLPDVTADNVIAAARRKRHDQA